MLKIINRKLLTFLYCLLIMPLGIFILIVGLKLFFSFVAYFKLGIFVFEIGFLKTAFKLALFYMLPSVIIWYLECRRLMIRIPLINDNIKTRWVEVANYVAEDINAKVTCPDCRKSYLIITVKFNEKGHELRYMSCPSCSTHHSIKMLNKND